MHSFVQKNLRPALALGALLASAAAAQAAITVANTFNSGAQNIAAWADVTSASFDLTGGNAVALLFTIESTSAVAPSFSATFGGQSMTQGPSGAVYSSGSGATQYAGIFYLLNPISSSGAFTITNTDTGSTANAFTYSAISLANVAGVAGSDFATSTTSTTATIIPLDYTTTQAGGFVLGAAVNNGNSAGRTLALSTPNNVDTFLFSPALIGTSSHLQGYGDVSVAGSYTDNYTIPYQRSAYVTLAFEATSSPVPEPSAFAALAGLGALGLVVSRRRRA